MKAIKIREAGGPEVLQLSDVDPIQPGFGQIAVKVAASGLNRADLLQRMGRYPAPAGAPPDIPGLEYAGVVEEVGPGVTGWSPGDEVMGIVSGGGYAERVVTHERTAVRPPYSSLAAPGPGPSAPLGLPRN
jgi:NADPH:quinone reductase-like Zn-dependent oxidoreductase